MKTAIIMAAGFGSRLMPITKNKPKTMVKVNGEMMIDNIIDQIKLNGFENIIVVTGYLSSQLESHLSEKYPQVKTIENKDYETTNNLYSFLMAAEHAEGDTLFLNSDLYFDKGFISKISSSDKSVISYRKGEWNDENMKVVVNEDKKAVGISKKFLADESAGVSCDTYFFKELDFKQFVSLAQKVKDSDINAWTEVAIHEYIKDNPINLIDTFEFNWFEIDNLDDLLSASVMFSGNSNLAAEYDTYIYDLDGTLYRDGQEIPGVAAVINKQIENGKNVFVITNNSARTATSYSEKLKQLGFNISEKNVRNSAITSIDYIKKNSLDPVYIFGTREFTEFAQKDIKVTEDVLAAKTILVGNNQELDFKSLSYLLSGIQNNKEAAIVATNPDILYPLKDGTYTIDCGTLIKIIESITDKAIKVIGKPNPEIISDIIEGKTILFGDRIYTDMLCAKNADIDSCIVMTGEANIIDFEEKTIDITRIVKSISDLK